MTIQKPICVCVYIYIHIGFQKKERLLCSD